MALGDKIRQNAALSVDFEHWYAKVKDRPATSAEINEYGALLERRSALFNVVQALPRYAETLDNREQWMDAFKKRYDAELLYFRLLMERDPQSRRSLYERFVSAVRDADRAFTQAADGLLALLEFSSIDCAQVKMCASDFSQ